MSTFKSKSGVLYRFNDLRKPDDFHEKCYHPNCQARCIQLVDFLGCWESFAVVAVLPVQLLISTCQLHAPGFPRAKNAFKRMAGDEMLNPAFLTKNEVIKWWPYLKNLAAQEAPTVPPAD